jgi:hypothetical protein
MRKLVTVSTKEGIDIAFVEDDAAARAGSGVVKTGIKETVAGAAAALGENLEAALQRVLQANVNAFMTAIESLETPPTELEIAFGLKVSTEIGGFMVSKLSGDANYNVTLS